MSTLVSFSRSKLMVILGVVALILAFLPLSASADHGYNYPSTNAENTQAGFPHVNFQESGVGFVTLQFVNDTNSLAYFEVRVDGEAPSVTPHPVVHGDFIYTDNSVCVDNRANPSPSCVDGVYAIQTFRAREKVEVRLALGGERDWDFDWVTFYPDRLVVGDPTYTMCANRYTGAVVSLTRSEGCPSVAVEIFNDYQTSYTFCISPYTGALLYRLSGCPAGYRVHVLPDHGDLLTCVSRFTGAHRAVRSHAQCSRYEVPNTVPVVVMAVN